MDISWLYFYNRSLVCFPGPYKVVNSADDGDKTGDQNRPVHVLRRDIRKSGPKAEKEYKCKIDAGKDVVRDAEGTRYPPRAPHDLVSGVLH